MEHAGHYPKEESAEGRRKASAAEGCAKTPEEGAAGGKADEQGREKKIETRKSQEWQGSLNRDTVAAYIVSPATLIDRLSSSANCRRTYEATGSLLYKGQSVGKQTTLPYVKAPHASLYLAALSLSTIICANMHSMSA